MRIGEIVNAKDTHDVITITPDAGVRELIATLAEHNIGARAGPPLRRLSRGREKLSRQLALSPRW